MSEERIAQRIKTIRTQRKMTLQDLADLTGLTKGYLSKIERSKKAPPFSTITRIANGLGVEASYLFQENGDQEDDPRIVFTKKGQGQSVKTVGAFYGYAYEALAAKKPGKNMIPYIIEPVEEETGVFHHEGEEFIYVLEGQHEFIYDGKSYMMEAGDSVYFDSGVPHTGRSIGPAKLLAVLFNYKRL